MKLLSLRRAPAGLLILAAACRTNHAIDVGNSPGAGNQDAAADGTKVDGGNMTDAHDSGAAAQVDVDPKGETGGSLADALLADRPIDGNPRDTSYRDTTPDVVPDTAVHGNSRLRIAGGWVSGCAVRDGGVWCWGAKGWPGSAPRAVAVPEIGELVSISAASWVSYSAVNHRQFDRYCGGLPVQGLKCWSVDEAGTVAAAPAVPMPFGVKEIAVESEYACALLRDGTIRCWGSNKYGELGDGTLNESVSAAVTVLGISNAIAVAVGGVAWGNKACAVLADGSVKCWGSNDSGVLGPAPDKMPHPVPQLVSDIAGAKTIALSDMGACVALKEGTAKC